MVYIFEVSVVVPETYITSVVYVILRMFDLRNIGSGLSKGASVRTQIYPICRIWKFRRGVFVSLLFQNGFFALMRKWWHDACFIFLWDTLQEFVCDYWVCEKFAPYIPVTRLLGRSGFGNAVGCVEADASEDTLEKTNLGNCLMWNDATVCGGRVRLKIVLRV